MNKIKLKRVFLIAITACTISDPIFAMTDPVEEFESQSPLMTHVPQNKSLLGNILASDIGYKVGAFLTPEELVVMSQTSHGVRHYAAILPSAERYAECIMNDQPVPTEIKAILTHVTDPAEKAKITRVIVDRILQHSGGILYRNKPMPPFLTTFFRAVSPKELDNTLQPYLNPGVFPGAVLHMKTYGTYWVENNVDVTPTLIEHARSYITLLDAIALSEGAVMPKHIIATADDMMNSVMRDQINTLFTNHQNCDLVVDFGEDAAVFKNFGNRSSIQKIAIVGKNLTTIGWWFLNNCTSLISVMIPNSVTTIRWWFLNNCTSLISVTIPDSVTTIGNHFLSHCVFLTSVTIPNSVTTIGKFFLLNCTSLKSVTIPRRFQNSVCHLPNTVQIIFNDNAG